MRIVSGLQSSGRLHLGNWFGAVRQLVRLQDAGEAFYFIADLHALTAVRDGEQARALGFETAVGLLALGIDPARWSACCKRARSARERLLRPSSPQSAARSAYSIPRLPPAESDATHAPSRGLASQSDFRYSTRSAFSGAVNPRVTPSLPMPLSS